MHQSYHTHGYAAQSPANAISSKESKSVPHVAFAAAIVP